MAEDHNRKTDPGHYNRRTFMALLSALGATGLAGCGDDGGENDTPTGTSADTPTETTGNGDGDTPTDTPTATAPPPTPIAEFDPVIYPRPDDAGVVFGEGVDGLSGLSTTPPDLGINEVPTYEEDSNTGWELADDGSYFKTREDTGNKWTRDQLGDVHLHVEFSPPDNANDASEQRSGNSGIFLMDDYEIQVLNNYDNDAGYGGGFAGALYQDAPPLVDPARSPTDWNAFDIIWTAPEFDDDDNVRTPATVTIFFNGVVVLPHINVRGPNFGGVTPYNSHPEEVTVRLQDHAGISDVSYRNIWHQTIPPQSETDGVSTFRQQYEYDAFDSASSTDDYISEPYNASFPEDYRENEGNDYGPPIIEKPGPDLAEPPADGQLSTVPDDATVLLEGGNMSGFADPGWSVGGDGGFVTVEPGAGNITSEATFGDSQVHVEFRIPEGADSPDSGVLLDDRYEINIAAEGTGKEGTGAYTYQAAPLRDATRSAGEWQAFDIVYQGPRFEDGALLSRPGRVTVLLNGRVVQQRLYLDGPNAGGEVGNYQPQEAQEPISLQENGSPVDFRYVWARELYPDEQREGYQ